jgi:hypothetical protein
MNIDHAHADDLIEAPDLAVATGSGRATWDEKGNSIWEWQTSPGVYSRDISSQQMQALQSSELSLQDVTTQVDERGLWSRNAKSRLSQRIRHATELVMPMRGERPVKGGGFEHFLKRMGLPA